MRETVDYRLLERFRARRRRNRRVAETMRARPAAAAAGPPRVRTLDLRD